jgi:hypothetical protein
MEMMMEKLGEGCFLLVSAFATDFQQIIKLSAAIGYRLSAMRAYQHKWHSKPISPYTLTFTLARFSITAFNETLIFH